jgi:hypothetical protein
MCGDPAFAPSVPEIDKALKALDIEADGNPDAERVPKILEIVSNKSGTVAERLEEMQRLTSMKGKVTVEVRGWKGWR